MSRISENIRKITRAWGGKTTGNGISDALLDLYNNLPFGVKTEMVEIVPEQSVTSINTGNNEAYSEIELAHPLIIGQTYTVIFNGMTYELEAMDNGGGEAYLGIDHNEDGYVNGNDFTLSYSPDYGSTLTWASEKGLTATIQITGEQEIITPLDIKYLPIDELKQALGIGGEDM